MRRIAEPARQRAKGQAADGGNDGRAPVDRANPLGLVRRPARCNAISRESVGKADQGQDEGEWADRTAPAGSGCRSEGQAVRPSGVAGKRRARQQPAGPGLVREQQTTVVVNDYAAPVAPFGANGVALRK